MNPHRLLPKLALTKPLDLIAIILVGITLYIGITQISRTKQTYYLDLVPQHNSTNDMPYTPSHWTIEALSLESSAYDASGTKIAEVVAINAVDAGNLRKRVKIKLKVYGIFDRRTNQFRINDNEIKIGGLFSANLNNTNFTGIVTHIGPDPNPPNYSQKNAKIRLLAQNIPNWHAATINNDFVITNTQNQNLFNVDTIEIKPAEKTGYTSTGQITATTDPLFKDVYLEATALVDCYSDTCYFLDVYPLKISQPWDLYSPHNQLNEVKVIQIISLDPLIQ